MRLGMRRAGFGKPARSGPGREFSGQIAYSPHPDNTVRALTHKVSMANIPPKLTGLLERIKARIDELAAARKFIDESISGGALAQGIEQQLEEGEAGIRSELARALSQYSSVEFNAARDLVFGDHFEEHHYHQLVFNISSPADVAGNAAIERYKSRLAEQLQTLKLPPLDHRHADMSGAQEDATLQDVFIGLETWPVDERKLIAEKKAQAENLDARFSEQREPQLLTKAVNEEPVAVLLGQPGSGKTSFVRRLILSVLEGKALEGWPDDDLDYLPLHVELRWFAHWLKDRKSHDGGQLWSFIKQGLVSETLDDVLPELRDHACQKKLLIVLDGLDEVPYELTPSVAEVLRHFMDNYPGNRFVLTCRILSWAEREWRLQDGLPLFGIRDFNDGQIDRFIAAWYQTARRRWGLPKAQTHRRINSLTSALQHERLQEIKRIPLLLTIMAMVHTQQETLPNELAVLYSAAVRILIGRWDVLEPEHQEHQLEKLLIEGKCKSRQFERVLEEIAWQAHSDGDSEANSGLADIPESLLKKKSWRCAPTNVSPPTGPKKYC